MSNRINHIRNILESSSWWKAKGPVVCGQEYVEKFQQDMLVWRHKVSNRSYIDIADVPFGMFVEIIPFNKHESYLTVYATPYVDDEDSPVFKKRCQSIVNLNEYICKATKCKQIVESSFTIPDDVNYWEANLTEIDDKHSQFETITVDEVSNNQSFLWDDNLNEDLSVTEQLVSVQGDSGWVEGNGNFNSDATITFSDSMLDGEILTINGTPITYLLTATEPVGNNVLWMHPDAPEIDELGFVVALERFINGVDSVITGMTFLNRTFDSNVQAESLGSVLTLHNTTGVTISHDYSNAVLEGYDNTAWGYFVDYEAIKCGWWIKKQEKIQFGVKESYCETRSFYWPPVLRELLIHPHDIKNSDLSKNLLHIDIKDSYNGPCKADILVTFGDQPDDCIPTQMLTDAFQYDGLQTRFSIPACLHPAVVINDTIGTEHPQYEPGSPPTIFRTFDATNYVDWPDTVVAHIDPQAYKGKYLTTKIVIHKPSDGG